jgi:hypothetical protein
MNPRAEKLEILLILLFPSLFFLSSFSCRVRGKCGLSKCSFCVVNTVLTLAISHISNTISVVYIRERLSLGHSSV